jgi:hypothetical protein
LKLTIASSLEWYRSADFPAAPSVSTRLRLLAALQFVNQPLAFVEVSGAALQ